MKKLPTNYDESREMSFDVLNSLSKKDFEDFIFNTDFDDDDRVKPVGITDSDLDIYIEQFDDENPYNINTFGQELITVFKDRYDIVSIQDVLNTLSKPVSFKGKSRDDIVDFLQRLIHLYLKSYGGNKIVLLDLDFDGLLYYGLCVLTHTGEIRCVGVNEDEEIIWDSDITDIGLYWTLLEQYENKYYKLPNNTNDLKSFKVS